MAGGSSMFMIWFWMLGWVSLLFFGSGGGEREAPLKRLVTWVRWLVSVWTKDRWKGVPKGLAFDWSTILSAFFIHRGVTLRGHFWHGRVATGFYEVGRPAAVGAMIVLAFGLQRWPISAPLRGSATSAMTPWPRPLGLPPGSTGCARESPDRESFRWGAAVESYTSTIHTPSSSRRGMLAMTTA